MIVMLKIFERGQQIGALGQPLFDGVGNQLPRLGHSQSRCFFSA